MIPRHSGQQLEKLLNRQTCRANDAPQRSSVQRIVHWNGEGCSFITFESDVTPLLANDPIADPCERPDARFTRDDR